jgi:TIR domain
VTLLAPGESSSRAGASTFAYDVFAIHASVDESFVLGYLLPELDLAPERVLLPNKLRPGCPIVGELERGVRSSRVTIVVLSSAYIADHWAVFGEQLAAYASVAKDVHGELLPLLREDCELPTHIRTLVKLDFRDPARDMWDAETDRLRQYLDRPAAAEPDLPCPYPGMRPFTEQDAQRFFGREAELDDLACRLQRGDRAIYVIGASGAGKSSLIAAGLVPRLGHGISGLPSFCVRTLRPGEHPLVQLAEALEIDLDALSTAVGPLLARHAPATSLLLVIDQLEELFAIASADQRVGFLAAVRMLRADARCVLVFTLRSDFYGAFLESPLWTEVDGQISRIELSALRSDSLQIVIERPARDAGVYVQPELVSRLLVDAAREPGALPLLQETLFRLWRKRRQRLLALADYQALGDGTRTGLAFAISEHAKEVLGALTGAQEAIAFRILLRLVSFGEGRADTRRQQARDALRSEEEAAADFDAVLQRLVDNRLVTVTGDRCGPVRVDLAHEILIHAWSTFADWIGTWRAPEQRRRELELAAAAWRTRGSGDGGLLDTVELANASAWRQAAVYQLGHSADLAAFLAASSAAQTRAIQQQQQRQLVRLLFAGIAVVGAISVIRIVNERDRADEQAARAIKAGHEIELRAEQLTLAQARSSVETNPTKAVAMLKPLAKKYWREVRAIAAAARAAGVAWSIPASQDTRTVEMSHDGQRALSAGADGVVRIYDLDQRTTQTILNLHTAVSARFADDTRQIVVWHDTALVIVDLATGKRRDVIAPTPVADLEVIGVTAYWVDSRHALWQLELAGTAPVQLPLQEPVVELAPSPDGQWIALSGEDHLFLYDRTQPTAPWLQVMMGKARHVAWSADGEELAALVDQLVIDVAMRPVPKLADRDSGTTFQFVAPVAAPCMPSA